MCLVSKQRSLQILFLPPSLAQGRHFWVDEEAKLRPLYAQGRKGPMAF